VQQLESAVTFLPAVSLLIIKAIWKRDVSALSTIKDA